MLDQIDYLLEQSMLFRFLYAFVWILIAIGLRNSLLYLDEKIHQKKGLSDKESMDD